MYILKRGGALSLDVRTWPYPAIDLERFVDPAIRLAAATPEAWRQRVPDDLLKSLPVEAAAASERSGADSNLFDVVAVASARWPPKSGNRPSPRAVLDEPRSGIGAVI